MSELTLLQNAYAALTPTKEILDEVLQIIENNLESSDEELRSNALLLRYDNNLLYHISNVVKNDRNNITTNTQNDLFDSLCQKTRDDLRDSVFSEVKEEFKGVEEHYKKLAQNLNKKDTKINIKEERLNKKEQDLQNKERILEARDSERKNLQNELWSTKQELINIKDSIKKRNQRISLFFNGLVTILGFCICGIITFIITSVLLVYCLTNLIEADQINNIYQICTFISFFITIGSGVLSYGKIIKKISQKTEEIIYNFLCNHSKYLNY